MATLEIHVKFESDDGSKGTEYISRNKGIPWDKPAQEAIDELALKHVGPSVTEWRNKLPNRQKTSN